jgi:6-phosphogluconolactonase (cycloisomerase 2 family)
MGSYFEPRNGFGVCVVAFATVCLLVGCGAHNAAPAASTQSSHDFVYVADGTFAYAVDSQTGALTEVSGSPFRLDFQQQIVLDPQNKFLFAEGELNPICCPADILSVYAVDPSTGAISTAALLPNELGGGFPGDRLAVHPSGKFFYVAEQVINNGQQTFLGIDGWILPTTGGNLTNVPGSNFGNNAVGVFVNPAGDFLYAPSVNLAQPTGPLTLQIYSIDQATGVLTPALNQNTDTVSITLHPSGKFAYVVPTSTSGTRSIDLYSVDATTGGLNFIGTQVAGNLSPPLMDPAGRFLYLPCTSTGANGSGCQISGYGIDSNTGALTPIAGFPVDLGAAFRGVMTIEKNGRFAYAGFANAGNMGSIFVLSIDQGTGAITEIPSLTVPVASDMFSMTATH